MPENVHSCCHSSLQYLHTVICLNHQEFRRGVLTISSNHDSRLEEIFLDSYACPPHIVNEIANRRFNFSHFSFSTVSLNTFALLCICNRGLICRRRASRITSSIISLIFCMFHFSCQSHVPPPISLSEITFLRARKMSLVLLEMVFLRRCPVAHFQ